jgi:hypothetical protein
MQHEVCKTKNDIIIEINDDLGNAMNNVDIIHYWHEEFQLTKKDENRLLNPNGWLNDQHLGIVMQILHQDKLQFLRYKQHTYAITGTINKIIRKSFQHVFIKNNN